MLVLLAGFMLFPLLLVFVDASPSYQSFILSFTLTAISGLTLVLLCKRFIENVNPRKMFLITALCWIGVCAFSSLPFLLSSMNLSVTDAVFESVSGITTTGSTILAGLDEMPKDLLLWRSIMQWIGGVGVIGMAIAVLPFLKVGAMRLFQTESSDWSEKHIERGASQLQYILVVYLVASILCFLYYYAFGMNWFDAICHAMTTISTGGYSTSDGSIGHFNTAIQWGAVFFMAIGGLPFMMYLKIFINRGVSPLRDEQVVAFLAILFAAGSLLTAYQVLVHETPFTHALLDAFLNTTSIITTTGYASADYGLWGPGAVAIFYFLTVVGGCSGSTSGGIKIFRLQLMLLFMNEQIVRSVHPRAVISLRYNRHRIEPDVISSFVAFMAMATICFLILTVALSLAGLDLVTSSSGALTAMMNVGPGLGETIGPAGNFSTLPTVAKWLLCVGMLFGRLEYLTLFVLLMPVFWRD